MLGIMKLLLACLLILALSPAYAQYGRPHGPGQRGPGPQQYGGPGPQYGGPGQYAPRDFQRQMPPPDRRMGPEDRQQLRDQVRNGQMTREQAREQWRERRGGEPARFTPQQREQLRRDVIDANRDLPRR